MGWIDEHRAGSARDDGFFVHCSFRPAPPADPPGDYWDLYAPADVVTCAAAGPEDVPLQAGALCRAGYGPTSQGHQSSDRRDAGGGAGGDCAQLRPSR